MPSTALQLVPGVNTDKTPSLNEAGISSSNMIRFREGLVEKRGGWTKLVGVPLNGVPRAIWAYRDFMGTTWVAVATTRQLVVISGGVATDISPRVIYTSPKNCITTSNVNTIVTITDPGYVPNGGDTLVFLDLVSAGGYAFYGSYLVDTRLSNGTNFNITLPSGVFAPQAVSNALNFCTYSTTQGSATISVNLPGHGLSAGFKYAISTPVSVGGLTLQGAQTIAAITDSNNFTIVTNKAATATASAQANGGAGRFMYILTPVAANQGRGAPVMAQDWSLGNYGKLLIACAAGGSIYQWDSSGAITIASALKGAPQASGILISDAAQQIVAYGGNPATLFDPNYVAWSDTGNPNTWTAAVGNQAGSYRIPTGSAIIGAATIAATLILLWTDVDVWAMQYVGYPTVYGFTKLAAACGLIAQFAWARMGGLTFWMSQNKFWVFDGATVQALDCPVYDSVFPLLSKANSWKIRGASNAAFGEVMWFFPSTAGTGENDTYVCYNPAEGTWDVGTMARSAWVDQSVAGLPLGADPSGNVYQHETSPDGAGQPIAWSFTTGLFQLSEGEDFAFVDRFRPDFKFPQGTGAVQVSILVYKYPGDAPVVKGPYSFTAATEYIATRCRGRYMALQFSGSDLGSFWRIGRSQFRYAPDGRR